MTYNHYSKKLKLHRKGNEKEVTQIFLPDGEGKETNTPSGEEING